MFNRSEKIFAGVLLILCAIVGIMGYSFSRTSSPPRKVWFDTAGGDVIFAHAYHTSLANCSDCHHDYDEQAPEDTEMNCRTCHYFGEARGETESPDPTHTRVIGANCTECHQDLGDAMAACDTCHIRQGLAFEASGRVMPVLPVQIKFDIEEAEVKDFDHKRHTSEAVGEPCITCHHAFKGARGWRVWNVRKVAVPAISNWPRISLNGRRMNMYDTLAPIASIAMIQRIAVFAI